MNAGLFFEAHHAISCDVKSPSKTLGVVGAAAMLAGSLLSGCGLFSPRGGDSQGYWLPLTVVVRFDPSVTGAMLVYADACQQPKTISAGSQLTYMLRREIGLAFERVRVEEMESRPAADGELEVSIGLKEVGLTIPRQADKSHTARVSLGGTVVFRDQAGAVLYTKSLRADLQGEVETTRQSCDVSGLAEVVNDAGLILAQGLKKNLGTSVKLQEYAGQREAARR
jgi:hypothetical protein